MKLSEEVEKSYLNFCDVRDRKGIQISIDYDQVEEKLSITEQGDIERYKEGDFDKGIPTEWNITTIHNKYTFTVNQQGEDKILEYEKSTQKSIDKGDSDGAIASGSYNQYEPTVTIAYYKVPENFKLEDGLDPSRMKKIEPQEEIRKAR